LLKSLTGGVFTGSMFRVIPLEAAERAHAQVEAQKLSAGQYKPKYFSDHYYKTLRALCDKIIPADSSSGGAVEAGAPEFIDLLTSENAEYQLKLGGGMRWLDSLCQDRFAYSYLNCTEVQQKQILDSIAYRKNVQNDPGLSQGVAFFSLLRNLTVDSYFTSKIGIEYLGYIGNTTLSEFPGCPDPQQS
jgi:gluconate 2-dehydrogenase gamma chain